MRYYVLRRVLLAILVLWLVHLMVFSMVRLFPGDVVMMRLAQDATMTKETYERARQELGIDRPFLVQYGETMGQLVRGDLGDSLLSGRPVKDELGDRVWLTLHLAIMSLIIAILIALPIGILSAIRQDTIADYGGRMFSILGLSLPDFWTGVVAILVLSLWFHWLPPRGFEEIWIDPIKVFQQLGIPALIIGFRFSAIIMRMTRSSMLEVLREDYIRTAWSKGLSEQRVIVGHALKNSFIPVITLVGQQFSILLGGTVIIETIFLLPGVGNMTLDAVIFRDYTLVQGAVIFFGGIMVVMNLLVDISYAWFDPRIRYG